MSGEDASRIAVVADDLTGAMDTGLPFATAGLCTVVVFSGEVAPAAEVVAIDLESRHLPAGQAYQRAREVASHLAGYRVYKKIDSTLRGNVGAELDGILDGLGLDHALVAPAYPASGRLTINGVHTVKGVPLAESEFARDPLCPVAESSLPALLARQTRRQVGHLPLAAVENGPEVVLDALRREPAQIVAADAAEPRHLWALAAALCRLGGQWIPCGSAGLAEQWLLALGLERRPDRPIPWERDGRPALVVAGSRSETTARQLRRAAAAGALHLVSLEPAEPGWHVLADERALSALQRGISVALTTTFARPTPEAAGTLAARLASQTAWILSRAPISGLVLTGGDIALAVCRRLGVGGLRILGEVQAGVPAGQFLGGEYDRLRVVTKAGGFGDQEAILQAIQCIQGVRCTRGESVHDE